jgi:hypothetical protein
MPVGLPPVAVLCAQTATQKMLLVFVKTVAQTGPAIIAAAFFEFLEENVMELIGAQFAFTI